MQTIWKYKLETTARQVIEMPQGRIIHVGLDPQGDICLWAIVETGSVNLNRIIYIFGTGQPIKVDHDIVYLGSVTKDIFVWHIFEAKVD